MNRSAESALMTMFRRLSLDPLAWALRRFHTPVGPHDLVLEVGSGGNPYPRANVLLDAYETSRERHWAPLASDRPTVLGFVENLPFRDQAFDYVIAAHVLEHSPQPEQFLSELQRVARAGYIEVPDAFLERVNPYRDHRLEITCRNQTLVIRKKAGWRDDEEVVELYEDRVKPAFTRELVPRHPFEFHVRYFWANRIAYRVLNPEVDAGWSAPQAGAGRDVTYGGSGGPREAARAFLRDVMSQRKRNAAIDLLPLLRCTTCHGVDLHSSVGNVQCRSCGKAFPVRRGMTVMNEGQVLHV